MNSDQYAVSTQAQALACLIAVDQYAVPAPMQLFDVTPDLVREFSALAFAGAAPEALLELSDRYAALAERPTFHAGVFQAILAFCQSMTGRLEAACVYLAEARRALQEAPPQYVRIYRHTMMQQLLLAADELAAT